MQSSPKRGTVSAFEKRVVASNEKISSAEYAPEAKRSRGSMVDLRREVQKKIPKAGTHMRNSVASGMWETNTGMPSQTVRDAEKDTIRLLNREELVSPEERRHSTIVKD